MKWLQAAVIAVLVSGCSGNAPVSISVRAGAPRSALAGVASQQLQVGNGIALTRARLLVRELELKTAEAASQESTQQSEVEEKDGEQDGREELESGPLVLDLSGAALEGGVQKVLDVAIPAGAYKEIEFKIAKASSSELGTSSDSNLKELIERQASVILTGTIDGQAFEFVSGLEVEQEFEGNFELADGANNLTLNVDPSSWFTDASGARLDPRTSEARSTIENNIKRSMKVLEDDDGDARDDEHEDDHGEEHDD